MRVSTYLARVLVLGVCVLLAASGCAFAQDEDNPGRDLQWRFAAQDNRDFARPGFDDSGWESVGLGHKWKSGGYAWFRCMVPIPSEISGDKTTGKTVGLKWNGCDGGECFVDGELFTRYDNDHPALLILTRDAKPGQCVPVAVRVFMGADMSEHDGSLGQCDLCIVDRKLVDEPFEIKVDVGEKLGSLPKSFAGLSQGAGLPDYSDEFALKLKSYGIKWFRMDNVLTNALKRNDDGELYYDWTDLDIRLDFMKNVGCEFIFCISYMPEALDAVEDHERHSYPESWAVFGELVYEAAKHCIERGTPVKYWEVWNEINTGWLRDPPGWDHLKTYTTLYDVCWKAVRRADPTAWIGGPALASGPWDEGDARGPGANGEKFMRGILNHCEQTGAPLDFITWHEYFQPHWVMKAEAEQIKQYLEEYPKVKAQVKEYAITEWNYAWWHDRAHDSEVGAAWAAASMLRGWMAGGVQKPCLFLGMDFSGNLCGEWGMFSRQGKPKATANVCKMFNMMSPLQVQCVGEDDQIAAIASNGPRTGRTTVLVLNFAERYGAPRTIRVSLANAPESLRNGVCKQYLVDPTHSNLFNDEARCELEMVKKTSLGTSDAVTVELDLRNNSVALLEFVSAD